MNLQEFDKIIKGNNDKNIDKEKEEKGKKQKDSLKFWKCKEQVKKDC